MKKLTKFILLSFIGPFILTFFIAVFVLLMQFIWLWVDDMLGKGIEWYVIAEFLVYASANLVPLALPLAMPLALPLALRFGLAFGPWPLVLPLALPASGNEVHWGRGA